MVRHWFRVKEKGWHTKAVINGIGGLATGVVAVVILTTKFTEGAWIVLVLVTIASVGLLAVNRRYKRVSEQLALQGELVRKDMTQAALVLVPRVHKGIVQTLDYTGSLHAEVRGLHITLDRKSLQPLKEAWVSHAPDVPLVVIESPYRSLISPVLEYIDQMLEEDPQRMVTVIVPEAVATKWHHKLLQENVAQQLKRALGRRQNVIVSNVRYFLK
ncbi:MAG: amino acid permease, partial [Armatimonadota bacterium]